MSRPRSEDTVQRAFRHEPGPLVIARGGRRETVEPAAKKSGSQRKGLRRSAISTRVRVCIQMCIEQIENNEEEKVSASNNKLNPAAARPQEERKAKCKNADNHDLGPWEELPIGDVPEVNGLWAVEMHEFVPTCAELLAIAEHWARVAIERTYVEWANATNTDDWRRIYFAWRRVYRVRALIGEVVDGVIDNKIKEFYEEQGRSWDPETWQEFLRKIDREAQKRHLTAVKHEFQP